MSRWAELFSALSTPDTTDTIDTRSGAPTPSTIVSASVEKCRRGQRVKPPPAKPAESLTKARVSGASVNCVHSVTGTAREGKKAPSHRCPRPPDSLRHFATLGPGTEADWVAGIAKLDGTRPPGDMPHDHWAQVVDNIVSFAASPFRAQAAVLGWDLVDLVGADPSRPFARIDRSGLLLLLGSHRLVALTTDSATIATHTGDRQTFYRQPNDRGRVVVWELPLCQ